MRDRAGEAGSAIGHNYLGLNFTTPPDGIAIGISIISHFFGIGIDILFQISPAIKFHFVINSLSNLRPVSSFQCKMQRRLSPASLQLTKSRFFCNSSLKEFVKRSESSIKKPNFIAAPTTIYVIAFQ